MTHLIAVCLVLLTYQLFLPTIPFAIVVAVCLGIEAHRLLGLRVVR